MIIVHVGKPNTPHGKTVIFFFVSNFVKFSLCGLKHPMFTGSKMLLLALVIIIILKTI